MRERQRIDSRKVTKANKFLLVVCFVLLIISIRQCTHSSTDSLEMQAMESEHQEIRFEIKVLRQELRVLADSISKSKAPVIEKKKPVHRPIAKRAAADTTVVVADTLKL